MADNFDPFEPLSDNHGGGGEYVQVGDKDGHDDLDMPPPLPTESFDDDLSGAPGGGMMGLDDSDEDAPNSPTGGGVTMNDFYPPDQPIAATVSAPVSAPVPEPEPARVPTPPRSPTPPRDPTPPRKASPPPQKREPSPPPKKVEPAAPAPRVPEPVAPVVSAPAKSAAPRAAGGCPFSSMAGICSQFGVTDMCHLNVRELIYWKDPKKSGIIFAAALVTLLAFSLCHVLSLIAYLLLGVTTGTFSYRVYRSVVAAINKDNSGNPFSEYLEGDVALPAERAHQTLDRIIPRLNTAVAWLYRRILVEDVVDTLKFMLGLYLLTFVAGWFSIITMLILTLVGAFTLPKFYQVYQPQIDAHLVQVQLKVQQVTEQVYAKVPMLAKLKEKAQ